MNIVIETHKMASGIYRAFVAEGPDWARGWIAEDGVRQCAFLTLRQDLQNERPLVKFNCIHAET